MNGSIVGVILLTEIIIDSIHNCFDQLCVIAVMIMVLYFEETHRPAPFHFPPGEATDNRCVPAVTFICDS